MDQAQQLQNKELKLFLDKHGEWSPSCQVTLNQLVEGLRIGNNIYDSRNYDLKLSKEIANMNKAYNQTVVSF